MFYVGVPYPEHPEEVEVVRRTTGNESDDLKQVMDGDDIKAIQNVVREVPIADHLIEFAVRLVRTSRLERGAEGGGAVPEFIRKYQQWGAGPRAAQYLTLGAKAHAFMRGFPHVAREDIEAVAYPVLAHRIIVNFAAQAEGVTPRDIIAWMLNHVKES
jgi:MoxR-like ATPase